MTTPSYNDRGLGSRELCKTNCMEQSPCWEANSRSDCEEILLFYEPRSFITVFLRDSPLVTILSQINPVHSLSYIFISILILPYHLCLSFLSGLFTFSDQHSVCIYHIFHTLPIPPSLSRSPRLYSIYVYKL
jgi:hypothetical protein